MNTLIDFDHDSLSDKGIKKALRELHAVAADMIYGPFDDEDGTSEAGLTPKALPPIDYVDGLVVVNLNDADIEPPPAEGVIDCLKAVIGSSAVVVVPRKPTQRVRLRFFEPRSFLERAAELSATED